MSDSSTSSVPATGEYYERMSQLALEFPTLHGGVPGISPWRPLTLDHWCATSGAVTSASRCAVQFLLHVWDDSTEWQCGPFSIRRAYGCWDAEHWAAFTTFIRWPFMP